MPPAASKKTCPVVENMLKIFSSPEWQVKSNESDVCFCARKVDWSTNEAILFKTFVPGVTPQTMEAVMAGDHVTGVSKAKSNCYKYEKLLEARKIIRNRDDGSVDLHSKFKSPVFLVGPRDTAVTCRPSYYLSIAEQKKYGLLVSDADRAKDGSNFEPCVFVQAGMDIADPSQRPPEQKGFQRVTAHGFGYIAQRVPGGCNIYLCLSLDPNGKLPAKLISLTNNTQKEKLVRIKALMKARGRVGGRAKL